MSDKAGEINRVTRSKAEAQAAYDAMSRWYDRLAGGFEHAYRNAGLHMLQTAEGEQVLDIGCGTGQAILALAEEVGRSGKVYAIDLSPRMLDVTRARVQQAGISDRVVLQCGDAAQLPFPDGSFDKLFMSFTLELFDTPEIPMVLAECRRVLRSDGRLCVVALSRADRRTLATRLYEWLHRHMPRYLDCRPIYAQQSLTNAGWRILAANIVSTFGLRIEIILAEMT